MLNSSSVNYLNNGYITLTFFPIKKKPMVRISRIILKDLKEKKYYCCLQKL